MEALLALAVDELGVFYPTDPSIPLDPISPTDPYIPVELVLTGVADTAGELVA